MSALRTGAMTARMKEKVFPAAEVTPRQLPTEGGSTAARDGLDGAQVARQDGGAKALHVGRPVPPHDVGERSHARLQVGHQTIERFLQTLGGGLGDVHVEFGRAHGLVAEHHLNGAQRHAAL